MCLTYSYSLRVIKWVVAVLISLCYIFLNDVNKMDTYFRKVKNFSFFPWCPDSEAKYMSLYLRARVGEIKHNLYLNMEDVK